MHSVYLGLSLSKAIELGFPISKRRQVSYRLVREHMSPAHTSVTLNIWILIGPFLFPDMECYSLWFLWPKIPGAPIHLLRQSLRQEVALVDLSTHCRCSGHMAGCEKAWFPHTHLLLLLAVIWGGKSQTDQESERQIDSQVHKAGNGLPSIIISL